MGNFYTDVIVPHPLFLSTNRIDTLDLLEPNLRRKVQRILEEAKAHGVELKVFETYRSQTRQEALYKQGVTELRKVSVHHYGLACDLVRIVNGELNWDADYTLLGHLARAHGLVWGGDWPHLKDTPHVQWCKVRDQAKLFSGDWYPDGDYAAE